MRKTGLVSVALVFLCGHVFASEDKNNFVRIGVGFDSFTTKPTPFPNDRYGHGLLSLTLGKESRKFGGVVTASIGGLEHFGEHFSAGVQGEFGPWFLKVGPGLALNHSQLYTRIPFGNDNLYVGPKSGKNTNVVGYMGGTLLLGSKYGGFVLNYRRGIVIFHGGGSAKGYMAVGLGIYHRWK